MKPLDSWPEWAKEAWEERAAILEHDAGMEKEKAERTAYFLVKAQVEVHG